MKKFNYSYNVLRSGVTTNNDGSSIFKDSGYNGGDGGFMSAIPLSREMETVNVPVVKYNDISDPEEAGKSVICTMEKRLAYVFYCTAGTEYAEGGDGTKNNPWASVNYALWKLISLLKCMSEHLYCGAYIKLKCSGVVDYPIRGLEKKDGEWEEAIFSGYSKLFICDLNIEKKIKKEDFFFSSGSNYASFWVLKGVRDCFFDGLKLNVELNEELNLYWFTTVCNIHATGYHSENWYMNSDIKYNIFSSGVYQVDLIFSSGAKIICSNIEFKFNGNCSVGTNSSDFLFYCSSLDVVFDTVDNYSSVSGYGAWRIYKSNISINSSGDGFGSHISLGNKSVVVDSNISIDIKAYDSRYSAVAASTFSIIGNVFNSTIKSYCVAIGRDVSADSFFAANGVLCDSDISFDCDVDGKEQWDCRCCSMREFSSWSAIIKNCTIAPSKCYTSRRWIDCYECLY